MEPLSSSRMMSVKDLMEVEASCLGVKGRREAIEAWISDNFGTQLAFAEKTGIPQSTVSRALKKNDTTDRKLSRLERAIDDLSTGEGAKYPALLVPHPDASGIEEKRIRRSLGGGTAVSILGDADTEGGRAKASSGEAHRLSVLGQVSPMDSTARSITYGVREDDSVQVEADKELLFECLGMWPAAGLRLHGVCLEKTKGGTTHLVLYVPASSIRDGLRHVLIAENLNSGYVQLLVRRIQELTGGGLKFIPEEGAATESELLLPEDGALVNQETGFPLRIHVAGRVLWPHVQADSERVQEIAHYFESLAGKSFAQTTVKGVKAG